MHIKEIAEVMAGYTFRGAIQQDGNGNIYVFQAKDLVQGEPFTDVGRLTKTYQETPGYSGFLRKNDILLIARGMKSGTFRSTIFMADASNVIASSSVHVIRITADNVLPEYVSLYLNSWAGQNSLAQIISGSYIGALPKSELQQIHIPIPPLKEQKIMVGLHQNTVEQLKLLSRKIEINQNIVGATFKNLTTQ